MKEFTNRPPHKWGTIRVFISSTFRDMHAERDYLVRFIFPELREMCSERHAHLVDVDLRWGVTEKEAQDGKTLDICLDEIDTCRPYFLGLFGHRYGWIPPGEEQSITASEIYHGVLHNDVPKQVIDLQGIIDGKLEGIALTDEELKCLVRCYQWDAERGKYLLSEGRTPDELGTIKSIFGRYSAYQRDRSFFFFRSESLSRKLAGSNTDDFIEKDGVNRDKLAALKQEIVDAGLFWCEYDDIEAFGSKVRDILWERIGAELEKPEEEERNWLEEEAELHDRFISYRTGRFVGRQDILERMQEFVEKQGDPSVMVIKGPPGCGKSALMARFTEELRKKHPDLILISHFAGASANSTSLRQTLLRFCTHLYRDLDLETQKEEKLKEIKEKEADEKKAKKAMEEVEKEFSIPGDSPGLKAKFRDFLKKAAVPRKVVFILDAVNQFETIDNALSMQWLPLEFPENVRWVISTLPGETEEALLSRRIEPIVDELKGLTDQEIRELVGKYLKEIRRKFPKKEVESSFFNKVKDGNPLYILVALEELRIFGQFEELADRISELPDSLPQLFDQMLERIESDFSPPLIADCMSLIACGRSGMLSEELQTLLSPHAPRIDEGTESEKLPDMLWARLFRSFRTYMIERSGVIDFFHGQLKDAVERRYLDKKESRIKYHSSIACYFEKRWREPYYRALDGLPFHFTQAREWDSIEKVLTDLVFFEAKCNAGMTYGLVEDYDRALENLPDAQEEKQAERQHREKIKRYSQELCGFFQGEVSLLEAIPSVKPWSDEKIREVSEDIINNPSRLNRMQVFSSFLNSESHILAKFASYPGFCLQHAYNFAKSGPLSAAENLSGEKKDVVLLLQVDDQRPEFNPHHALFRTLEGHTKPVTKACISADGSIAFSGSEDGLVCVWDLESGLCQKTLAGHRDSIKDVSITPDGKLGVSIDKKSVRVWDLETGKCVSTLEETHESVRISPNGKVVISNKQDKTFRVWDPYRNEYLDEKGSSKYVNLRAHTTPDGKISLSKSPDNVIKVMEVKTGRCINELRGHTKNINSMDITADGKMVISGSGDVRSKKGNEIRVWDVESGECLRKFKAFSWMINSVSITADGRRAISTEEYENNIWVWDIEKGRILESPEKREASVTCVSVSPDCKEAVSGDSDNMLRVWNLENRECLREFEFPGDFLNSVASDVVITPPVGGRALSVHEDGWIQLWDPENGTLGEPRNYNGGACYCISITPDGAKAVVGCEDGFVRVLDLTDGECLFALAQRLDWEYEEEMVLISEEDMRDLYEDEQDSIWSVSAAPDGKVAVSGSVEGILNVWDIENGACLQRNEEHSGTIHCLKVTADGRKAVSGSHDWTLRVWDLKSGECNHILEGHTDKVICVSITPDGRFAVSGSDDKTIRVWDMERGECVAVYHARNGLTSMSEMLSGGSFFVYATDDGEIIQVKISNSPVGIPIATPAVTVLLGEDLFDNYSTGIASALCSWCGKEFMLSNDDMIREMNEKAGIESDESSCLNLPNEAWEDPRLLIECVECHKPLRLNPFVLEH